LEDSLQFTIEAVRAVLVVADPRVIRSVLSPPPNPPLSFLVGVKILKMVFCRELAPPTETTTFLAKCLQSHIEPVLQSLALSALSAVLAIDKEVINPKT